MIVRQLNGMMQQKRPSITARLCFERQLCWHIQLFLRYLQSCAMLQTRVWVQSFCNGVDHTWQPLCFFLRKLSETEKKYSTYDRELLAIFTTVKYFRLMIEGNQFIIFTDHKVITYAFSQKMVKFTPRQSRNLDFIVKFSKDIRHISGKNNTVADALFRVETIAAPSPIDYEDFSEKQKLDEQLQELLQQGSTISLILKPHKMVSVDHEQICDVSTAKIRPYVPKTLRTSISNSLHNY